MTAIATTIIQQYQIAIARFLGVAVSYDTVDHKPVATAEHYPGQSWVSWKYLAAQKAPVEPESISERAAWARSQKAEPCEYEIATGATASNPLGVRPGFVGRFTKAGLAAFASEIGLTDSERVACKVRDAAPTDEAFTKAQAEEMPFGSFNVGRKEIDEAEALGFEVLKEDQGNGWSVVNAAGMTLGQIGQLDAGLSWLEWLVKDGTFWAPMNDKDLTSSYSRATQLQKKEYRRIKQKFNRDPKIIILKKMTLYGALLNRLEDYVNHASTQERLAEIYPQYLAGHNGNYDLESIKEIQEGSFLPHEELAKESHNTHRFLGPQSFEKGPSKNPGPKFVEVQVTRHGKKEWHSADLEITKQDGDEWAKLKGNKLADAIHEAQDADTKPWRTLRPDDHKNRWYAAKEPSEKNAWRLIAEAVEKYEAAAAKGAEYSEEADYDAQRYTAIKRDATMAIRAAVAEVNDWVKANLCQQRERAGDKIRWFGILSNLKDRNGQKVDGRAMVLEARQKARQAMNDAAGQELPAGTLSDAERVERATEALLTQFALADEVNQRAREKAHTKDGQRWYRFARRVRNRFWKMARRIAQEAPQLIPAISEQDADLARYLRHAQHKVAVAIAQKQLQYVEPIEQREVALLVN